MFKMMKEAKGTEVTSFQGTCVNSEPVSEQINDLAKHPAKGT